MELGTKTHERRRAAASSVFKRFVQEPKYQPFTFAFVIAGILIAQAGNIWIPVLMRSLLNVLASHVVTTSIVQQLEQVIALIAVAMSIRWLGYRIEMWSLSNFEVRAESRLVNSSFEHLMKHSQRFFSSNFTGTLTRRVINYGSAFVSLYDACVMNFFPTALFIVGAVFVLFLHNHTLGVVLGAWSVGYISMQIYLSRKHHPIRVLRTELGSKATGIIADSITNHNAVALFSGVDAEASRVYGITSELNAVKLRSWRFMEYVWGAQGLMMIVINIGLLWGAFYFWGKGQLTIGDFVLIQTYLVGSFEMLNNITPQLRRFYEALADAEEMVAILEEPHEIRDMPYAKPLVISHGEINFNQTAFYFNESTPIFENFNLRIRGGEKIALVGVSGAGKSTITKLLLRLYDVQSGCITIDGQNITEVAQDSLRNAIAFVPQEPVLFHRTLMENIRYGRREATDEGVIEAAKQAHCDEFISKLPAGYDTLVGERGVKLSGGERQRVAIARAVLKNAPILVLDEATSSLDSESEAFIQDALSKLMEGKTVVAIAHRLSTIMKMDRIVVLENGKIVDEGTHLELLKTDGLYQKLWNIQAGGFIE